MEARAGLREVRTAAGFKCLTSDSRRTEDQAIAGAMSNRGKPSGRQNKTPAKAGTIARANQTIAGDWLGQSIGSEGLVQ